DPFGGRAFPCTPGGGPIFGCEALLAGPLVPDALPPDAMDMETAAVARVAGDAGVPYVAFRGVSDGSGDPLGLPGFPAQFFAYYRLAAENAAAVTTAFLAASNLSDTDRADRARGRRATSRRPRVAAACDWERAASPACAGERAPRAIKNRVARACRLLAKAAAATPGSAAARMAERERGRDRRVGAPLGDELEELALPPREPRQVVVVPRRLIAEVVVEQHARDLGVEERPAAADHLDRLHEIGVLGVLHQVTARARLQALANEHAVGVHGEDEHLGVLLLLEDAARRLDPVQLGERQVHQHHV